VRLPVPVRQTGTRTGREEEEEKCFEKYKPSTEIFFRYRETVIGIKEKKDKGIGGTQFLPTNFQEDKRGKIRSIVF